MKTILSILGIIISFLLLKYRETIGDVIGESHWMQRIGGVYLFVVYVAIFIFFWSIAELTGTTSLLFAPLTWLFPSMRGGESGVSESDIPF